MKLKATLMNKINSSPLKPGCYLFKTNKGKLLYIGKAINIRNRVKSYFTNYKRLDPKNRMVVDQIQDVEFITTDTELEALILETNLIKKYKPKYNKMMKDDKNYAWLMITKGEDFPRLEIVRERKIKNADYLGPYADLRPIRRALKRLRKIFPYRTCKRTMYFHTDKSGKKKFYSSDPKPCLYLHLGLCDAPCDGSVSKAIYRKNINNIKRFFRSKKFAIIEDLTKEMKRLALEKKFEQASVIRDKLTDLTYIAERIRVERDMDEKSWIIKRNESVKMGLSRLIKQLRIDGLRIKDDFRIECYDISNIQGKSATGSMVVFTNGKGDKSQYRKFRIKFKEEPDDFFMLQEVLSRRFRPNKKDRSFAHLPDLLIVDGGKGQLSSVASILVDKNVSIPTIGLAKKQEEIFKIVGDEFRTVRLRKGSEELFLIQRIRDEAHRFAIRYHRTLRSKKQLRSVLDTIPGVGDVVKKRLLKAFGSERGIKKASSEQLQSVVKNKKTVENIKKLL